MKLLSLSTLAAVVLSLSLATRASSHDSKHYPLHTCVVSGDKLGGDMDNPYVFKHDGTEVQLCCKSCLKDFNKDPAKYMAMVKHATKHQHRTGLATNHRLTTPPNPGLAAFNFGWVRPNSGWMAAARLNAIFFGTIPANQ